MTDVDKKTLKAITDSLIAAETVETELMFLDLLNCLISIYLTEN